MKNHLDISKVEASVKDGKLELRDIEFCTTRLSQYLKGCGINWLSPIQLESVHVEEISIHIPWTKLNDEPIIFNLSGIRIVARVSSSSTSSADEDLINKSVSDEGLYDLPDCLEDAEYEGSLEEENAGVHKNNAAAVVSTFLKKIRDRMCYSLRNIEIRIHDDNGSENAECGEREEYSIYVKKLDWKVADKRAVKAESPSSTLNNSASEANDNLVKTLSIQGLSLRNLDTWIIKGEDSDSDIGIQIELDTESANRVSYRISVQSSTKILVDLPLKSVSGLVDTVKAVLSQYTSSQANGQPEDQMPLQEFTEARDVDDNCIMGTGC